MRTNIRVWNAAVIWAIAFCGIVPPLPHAQEKASVLYPSGQNWLLEPEREDFHWSVSVSKPSLTYQLRYFVEILARIPMQNISSQKSPTRIVGTIAVGDAHQEILQESRPVIYDVSANPGPDQEIRFVAGVYLRSGDYHIGVKIEEPGTGRRNIRHKELSVPTVPGRFPPEWEDHFPSVEFAADIPDGILPGAPRRGVEIWSLAHPRSHVSIPVTEPLLVDVVLLGTKATVLARGERPVSSPGPRGAITGRGISIPGPPPPPRLTPFGMALQIGSVLSTLDLERSCIRLSVIDYRWHRVLVDREDARSVNWDKVQNDIWASDTKVVDKRDLEKWSRPTAFLKQEIQEILSDPGTCEISGRKPRRFLVLAGYEIYVQPGTDIDLLDQQFGKNCGIYYLLPESGQWGITDLLQPVHPRVLEFSTPSGMSRVLARLIEELTSNRAMGFPNARDKTEAIQ